MGNIGTSLLSYLIVNIGPHSIIIGLIAASLLIFTVYLRQSYGKKISALSEPLSRNFFDYSEEKGSFIKVFAKWVGVKMILQLMALPLIFPAAGALISSIVHPVFLSLPTLGLALSGIVMALAANITLILIYRKDLTRVEHEKPTPKETGFHYLFRTIVVSTGILLAIVLSRGQPVFTIISVGVVMISALTAEIVTTVMEGRKRIAITKTAQEVDWAEGKTKTGLFKKLRDTLRVNAPAYIGIFGGSIAIMALLGIAYYLGLPVAAGEVVPNALAGMKVMTTPQFWAAPVAIIGIGTFTLLAISWNRLRRLAESKGQKGYRTAGLRLLDDPRNVVMLGLSILSFFFMTSSSLALLTSGVAILGALIVYRYRVNVTKRLGVEITGGICRAVGGTVLASGVGLTMAGCSTIHNEAARPSSAIASLHHEEGLWHQKP